MHPDPVKDYESLSIGEIERHYKAADQIDLKRWMAKSRDTHWDYKNIVRPKGRLERLT